MGMTIATMTWRSLSRGWRPLLLMALPLGGLALALLLRVASGGVDEVMADQIVRDLATGVIVPLAALLVAVNGIGNEVDDSSVLHILATPTSRASSRSTPTATCGTSERSSTAWTRSVAPTARRTMPK